MTIFGTSIQVAAVAASGQVLTGLLVSALLLFIIQRDVALALGPAARSLSRNVRVAIGPLLIVFALLVINRLSVLI